MYSLLDDPVVRKKHEAQKEIIKKTKGNFRNYSKIAHSEVIKLRKKFPDKFPQAKSILSSKQHV